MKLRNAIRLGVLGLAALAAVAPLGCARTTAQQPEKAWRTVLRDDFSRETTTVNESMFPTGSPDPNWWVDSGAGLTVRDGIGSTPVGVPPVGNYYRGRYELNDPVDSDGGTHPQNLFRLLTKSEFGDAAAQCDFRILAYNLSDSPQRYDANGLLLFSRYRDAKNLYYAGIRVDGHAVVKKKSAGVYYTLAEKKVLPGTFDRRNNPTLLPKDRWIRLRAETENQRDGSVKVSLYMDSQRDGHWKLLLEGIDAGVGGEPFTAAGRSGIRTDFMDVQFDDYSVAQP